MTPQKKNPKKKLQGGTVPPLSKKSPLKKFPGGGGSNSGILLHVCQRSKNLLNVDYLHLTCSKLKMTFPYKPIMLILEFYYMSMV